MSELTKRQRTAIEAIENDEAVLYGFELRSDTIAPGKRDRAPLKVPDSRNHRYKVIDCIIYYDMWVPFVDDGRTPEERDIQCKQLSWKPWT